MKAKAPLSKGPLLVSLALHGAFLAALGRIGLAPPEAPVIGGGGQDGIEILLRAPDVDQGDEDLASVPVPVPAAAAEPAIAPASPTVPAPPPPPDFAPAPLPAVAPDAAPGPVAAVPDGAGIPEPRYPASCRRLGHVGTAIVRIEVGADGQPGRVDLVRSAGCIELDRAALDALRRSRFRPAWRAGGAVASVVEQRIRFQLR